MTPEAKLLKAITTSAELQKLSNGEIAELMIEAFLADAPDPSDRRFRLISEAVDRLQAKDA